VRSLGDILMSGPAGSVTKVGYDPRGDGLYVLQLNADGLQNQGEIVGAATDVIDEQTTITP